MPVSASEIEKLLELLPARFSRGLKAVFLLAGAKQQSISQSIFAYGRYRRNVIFLHPYPKARMKTVYKKPLRPHIIQEYQRAGAEIIHKGRYFAIKFDEAALRSFYLRDVMIHEIGHHVDRLNFGKKRERREEPFAEWFATQHGYHGQLDLMTLRARE